MALLLVLAGVQPVAGEHPPVPAPDLTAAERAWLAAHPVIRIGVDPVYAPYAFIDAGGRFQGVAADFAQIISDQLGVRFEVVPGLNWQQIIAGAEQRTLDVITTAAHTPERERFLGFTDIYIPTPLVIMTRADRDDIGAPGDLTGRTVALVKGYSSTARVLRETTGVRPLLVPDPLAGLRAVAAGEADAYVGVLGVNTHLAAEYGIANLKVAGAYDMVTNGQRFGVRSDWPQLVTILDKALDAIPADRKADIFRRWVPVMGTEEGPAPLHLSAAEHAWLAEHPEIRVAISPHDEPFEYLAADGERAGVASGFLDMLTQRTGLRFVTVPADDRMARLRQAAAAEVDLVAATGAAAAARAGLLVSEPFYESALALFTRKDAAFAGDLVDLDGETVAVVAASDAEQRLLARPDIRPLVTHSTGAALQAVVDGQAAAALADIGASAYLKTHHGFDQLRFSATLPASPGGVRFALRPDWPVLRDIVDKVLAAASPQDVSAIQRRWLGAPLDDDLPREMVLRWALGAGVLVLLAFAVFYVWNWRLGREVALRRRAEQDLLAYQSELEERVSERTRSLRHQATHDGLTGLLNRDGFHHQLELALDSARSEGLKHALLYLDMDQFKVVNDTCGHRAGDELLRQLAELMRAPLRERDTLARLGGDEFGILLEGCAQDVARSIGNHIRELVEEHRFAWEGRVFRIGVSIGVVPVDATSSSVEALLSAADMACFAAKDAGRNRVHLAHVDDAEMRSRAREMEWLPRLEKALHEDALRLYYQRIVPTDPTVEGRRHCELLLRLPGEDQGLILPGAFVPASERYGLMTALDRWVLRQVFACKALFDVAGDTLCSINLSGQSLADTGLTDYVLMLQDTYGVDPSRVCFEITETAAISNLSDASHLIARLHQRGYRFALDDFGSGLSSFSYLKNLTVDFLKIDGSFVTDMVRDPMSRTIVESVVRIGQTMGMKTVAECVEDEATVIALREAGVDYMQGYHLHRPKPVPECAISGAAFA